MQPSAVPEIIPREDEGYSFELVGLSVRQSRFFSFLRLYRLGDMQPTTMKPIPYES